ncbi:MAG: prephenate dehydratase domain-containing protein, partial [Ilumatobacter sp.]
MKNDQTPQGRPDTPSVAFLGPFGTFTEQALRSQADVGGGELTPMRTVPDVLDAVSAGTVDYGFVPIEKKRALHVHVGAG